MSKKQTEISLLSDEEIVSRKKGILCPSLTDPDSGSVALSTSGTETVAAYSCSAGYSLNGNAERTCNPDGTWSDSEPTCTCDTPTSPLNGLVTDDGETAVYSCNQGYSMNGLSTRTCGTDGSAWSGSAPTCSTCSTLSTPSGGAVNLSTDGINTRAEYTCNTGYTLNGLTLITCRNDGTWDFTEPSCVKCADLSDPDSGTLILATTGSVTTATFTCQSGYYLKGEFSLTCDTDGTWSNDAPTCHCNFPVQPDNGQISLSGSGTVATYRCETGYTLNGLSARACQTDGTGWEGAEPQCTLCQTISSPSSGSFSLSTNGTHTTVHYACTVGTSLDGENEIMCAADGSWVTTPPTCVQCGELSNPDSGFVSLSTDGLSTTATFSCVTGYTLNSTGILKCMSSGAWDLSSPYCICQPPTLISNGEFNISSDLRTLTYTCNVGYVLVGSETRTCQNDGTGWDGISPVCDTVGSDNGIPKDDSVWNIPIAAVLIFLLLFVGLGVLLVALTYLYCKVRKKKSKIETVMPKKPEEHIVEAGSPEELPEPKPTGEKATLVKKYHSKESRPGSSLTTSNVIFANGLSTPVKAAPGKVQLPPISHVITEKRGKKKAERLKKTSRAKVRRGGEEAVARKEDEVDIFRAKTPDLLHALEFNYIQPVYSYEIDKQAETGRESVASRRRGKMKIVEKKKKSGH